MRDAEGKFTKGRHFLGVNLLFSLGDVAGVCFSDPFETFLQPLSGGVLLRVGEQLVRLSANFPSFIIRQLVTHLLDEYEQRPLRALAVATPFGDPPRAFNDRLCLLLMLEAT